MHHDWRGDDLSRLLDLAESNPHKTVFAESDSIELAVIVLSRNLSNVRIVYQAVSPQIDNLEILLKADNCLVDNGTEKLSPCDYISKYFPEVVHQTLRGKSLVLMHDPRVLYISLLRAIVEAKVSRQEIVDFLLKNEFLENTLAYEWQAYLCEALLLSYSPNNRSTYVYLIEHMRVWIEKIEAGDSPWGMNISIRTPSRKNVFMLLKAIDEIESELAAPSGIGVKIGVLSQQLQDLLRWLGIEGLPGHLFVVNTIKIKVGEKRCDCSIERLSMLRLLVNRLDDCYREGRKSYHVRFDQRDNIPFGSLDHGQLFVIDEKPGAIYVKNGTRGGLDLRSRIFYGFTPIQAVHEILMSDQVVVNASDQILPY